MTTAAKIVNRALRLIQVIDVQQTPSAADMQTGIEAMNAMLRRWEANTLSLGWQPVDNPSDEVPIPEEAEEAVCYNLAIRLAPEYGVSVPAEVAGPAAEFLNDLRRDQAVATPIQPIVDVPTPDRWSWANRYGSNWYVG